MAGGLHRRLRDLGARAGAPAIVLMAVTASGAHARPDALPRDPVVVAAGEIADNGRGDSATAKIIARISPTAVLPLGDSTPAGTTRQFRALYRPTWGRYRGRTRPVAGGGGPPPGRARPASSGRSTGRRGAGTEAARVPSPATANIACRGRARTSATSDPPPGRARAATTATTSAAGMSSRLTRTAR